VSLQGRFGEIRVGRDFAPSVWNATAYDPFGTVGVGQNLMNGMLGIAAGVVPGTVAAPLRNSNSIAYFLPPNAGGFLGQAQYAFGENSSSNVPATKAGNYAGFRLGYADGPVNVAVSHGQLQTGAGANQGHTRATNLGGSYNFGVATAMAVWAREESRMAFVGSTLDAWQIGASAPIGVGELRAAYGHYDLKNSANDFRKLAIGYVYNLSKRTQLYTAYARVNNKGASNVAVTSSGLSVAGLNVPGHGTSGKQFGIRHAF